MPPPAALYWRGPVLGNYDGRRWIPLAATSLPPSTRVAVRGKPVRYQVTQEAGGRQSLFALDVPVASPQLPNHTVRIQPDMQVIAFPAVTERVRYDVASSLDYQLQADETPVVLRDWMQLPPSFNPRTHEFATQLRSRSNNDLDMVDAVLQMFRNELLASCEKLHLKVDELTFNDYVVQVEEWLKLNAQVR